jgi:hypothetical protein
MGMLELARTGGKLQGVHDGLEPWWPILGQQDLALNPGFLGADTSSSSQQHRSN